MKSVKYWTIYFIFGTFACYVFIGVFQYMLDTFGVRSLDYKVAKNISIKNPPYVIKSKIEHKAPFYLIGSSRTWFLDLKKMRDYVGSHTLRVGMAAMYLDEELFVAEMIKQNNGNFFAGFDLFSVSKSKRKNRLTQVFQTNKIESNITLYMNWETIVSTIREIKTKLFNQSLESEFEIVNNKIYDTSFKTIDGYASKNNIELRDDEILRIAQIADENDIFVIFPKYFYVYTIFARSNAEQEYFKAIKFLVKNTKAKVYSFYGISDISINGYNFDIYGWHFKPKIGDLIMARIFGDSETLRIYEQENNVDLSNFGVELNSENIDEYLESVKYDFEKYKPYLEKALDEPQNANINKDEFLKNLAS